MRRLLSLPLGFLLMPGLLNACVAEFPEHVDLQPAAAEVEFATEPPSADAYWLVGSVTGVAAAHEVDAAQQAARNDMRNKAAALGASLVTIDRDTGEALPLRDKTKVTLVGRAYKSVD
jgi:uncharacterized protein DUF4156